MTQVMQQYHIYNTTNRIIGWVAAITGDIAWELTKITQPQAAYLKPTLTHLI